MTDTPIPAPVAIPPATDSGGGSAATQPRRAMTEAREASLIGTIRDTYSIKELEIIADILAADGELTALIRTHIKRRMDQIAKRK